MEAFQQAWALIIGKSRLIGKSGNRGPDSTGHAGDEEASRALGPEKVSGDASRVKHRLHGSTRCVYRNGQKKTGGEWSTACERKKKFLEKTAKKKLGA